MKKSIVKFIGLGFTILGALVGIGSSIVDDEKMKIEVKEEVSRQFAREKAKEDDENNEEA